VVCMYARLTRARDRGRRLAGTVFAISAFVLSNDSLLSLNCANMTERQRQREGGGELLFGVFELKAMLYSAWFFSAWLK